jgi:HAD superfamily hydrolase (TIGR01509 family)
MTVIMSSESSKTPMIWPLMTDSINPSAIILDFDGVVVDSLSMHLDAWAQATTQVFGISLQSPEELTGHATRTIAGILAKRLGDPSLAPTLVRVKQHILVQNLKDLQPIEGAKDFIEEAQRLHLPLGIASNSRRDFVEPALRAVGITVPVVVCGDDVSRPKPRPDIFWECARRIGMTHQKYSEVLVFEDSLHGIKAALAAGMVPIGLTTESSAEKLLKAGAHAVCSNLREAHRHNWLLVWPKNTLVNS